jgi:hypothetical protein
MQVTFNPMAVGSFGGNFQIDSGGYVQGDYIQDPAIRFSLATGVVASTETLPMHGGVAITETLGSSVLGNTLARATSDAGITGFTVFNQAHNGILLQGNGFQVPLNFGGQTMSFFRLGSGARIPVACDPALTSLIGGSVTPQVTWDYNLQMLVPYDAATASVNVTSITAAYSATTGLWTFAVVAAAAANVAAVGDIINVLGVTGTGAASINGLQKITSFTDNQHFSFQIKDTDGSGLDFTAGAQAGAITLVQATGALSVKVLDIQIGNSKVVRYVAGAAQQFSWDNGGSVALIQI